MSLFDAAYDLTKPKPRLNPQTGYEQILVPDPDYPGRSDRYIWVDALWNPASDLMIPIDPRYRRPGETYPVDVPWRWSQGFAESGSGIDFSGPLDLPLPADGSGTLQSSSQLSSLTRPASSDNGTVLLLVGALVGIYLMFR